MYLSGSFLGLAVFQKLENIPIRRVYSKIRIYGASTVNNLQILDKELTNTEIEDIDTSEDPAWTSDTLLLAKFNGNLVAGNIDSSEAVEEWQVIRKESGSDTLTILDTIDVSEISFVDYTCQQDKNYIYDIFPLTATQICQVLETAEIETDFFGYFLIGEDSDGNTCVYKFDLNVTSGSNDYQEDVTIYETFTQYPSIAIGERKYLTTNISAICGTISTTTDLLLQPIEYLDQLRDFILDGKTKLWKSRKGSIHNVFTHNFKYQVLNDGIGSQPMVVSFDVIEVSDV